MRQSQNAKARPASNTAKLFLNGRSQAVRLPKEYRFPGSEVSIRREGESVILEPLQKRQWPRGFWKKVARMQARLEIGEVEAMPAKLLDLSLDAE